MQVSTVVGYQNMEMRPSGNTMMGGTFTTVSAGANKFSFRDLSVKLLASKMPKWDEDEEDWVSGCRAPLGFCVDFFSETGAPEKTVYWQYFKTGSELNPTTTEGWFKNDGTGTYVPLTVEELAEIKVPAGQAMWILGNGNTLNVPAPELTK